MKRISVLFLTLTSLCSFAQNTARITVTALKNFQAQVTLIEEDVHFHPNLGIGLADTKLETLASINFMETLQEQTTVQLTKAKMVRLQYSGGGITKNRMLFIQPGDDLKATFSGSADVTFTGKNAPYQTFLQEYFLENQYQYLPLFGYKPSQLDNKNVVHQSDSLKQIRQTAFQTFKKSTPTVPAFDAYVQATTETEPAVIHRLIQERIMRRNRVTRLEPAQKKELEDLTLNQFKILPDDALLSQSYRDELRNWALIPSTRKYPLNAATNYEISADALKDVYAFSKQKLQNFPQQKEYLLTYWLNYAATAIPEMETAKTLLKDYQATFPQSAYGDYISKLLTTKETLQPGKAIAEMTLLNADSTHFSISQLKGKAACLVFAFSIGQHEPSLKALEEKYKDRVTFVYIAATAGIPLGTWKAYATERANTKHLWASDENIELLKEKYAMDIRYPFLVIDAAGKIVNRWIPLEFPNNKTLDHALNAAAK